MNLLDTLSFFSTAFLGIFIEALPFLLLGCLASGLVAVYWGRADLAGLMPRRPVAALPVAALLGLFFPVGEAGAAPLARRFYQKGAPVAAVVTFLLAAPALNPAALAITWSVFGFGALFWGRIVMTYLVAVLTGVLFLLHPAVNSLLRPLEEDDPNAAGAGRSGRLLRAAVVAGNELFHFGRYLVIGGLVAAAAQVWLPQTAWLPAARGAVSAPALLALRAAVLSGSSLTDALAAQSLPGGPAVGSLLAFLVIAAMLDLKNLALFLGVFRKRALLLLAGLPLALILVAAMVLNLALGGRIR